MKVVLFGATGMIGQGVLRECLLDDNVTSVLAIVRRPTGKQHAKLKEIVHGDFLDFSSVEGPLVGYDACLYCLGVSSSGMSEADYTRVTYDVAVAAARSLLSANPRMKMVFISGASTDGSEKGRVMWARIKGKTENALLAMPFAAAYMMRPGIIQPLHGIKSGTKLYRAFYVAAAPLFPIAKALFPRHILTTEQLGKAMIKAAKDGAPKTVLEATDIADL